MTPSLRSLPALACACALASAAFASCQDDRQSYVRNVGDGESTPTMLTLDVNTFISDSGYTRYYITAPIWGMYDESKDPFWLFPEGLELEQYDRSFNPTSNFRCDSARYWSQRRIWKLDGNVVMVNTDRDTFLTQQVYWDQSKREVHSDSFVHIVRSDRIIEGYGFRSNEQMTEYTVNLPTGIFPIDRDKLGQQPEAADSAEQQGTDARRRPRAPQRASATAIEQPTEAASIPKPGAPHNDTRLMPQPIKH